MNKTPRSIGTSRAKRIAFFSLAVLLAGCTRGCEGGFEFKDDNTLERLDSCSLEDSPFILAEFDQWKTQYHDTVSAVIQADIDSLGDPLCIDRDDNLPPPTEELKDLAGTLPPWNNSPSRLAQLSEADMSAVLLEYLRTYQCAMLEYRAFYTSGGNTGESTSSAPLSRMEFAMQQGEREELIKSEMAISREAMNRTLALTGRLNRLRPLFFEIDCFLAASVDLRNLLGLGAEISACLPRIQDAHGSLRDFALPSSSSGNFE